MLRMRPWALAAIGLACAATLATGRITAAADDEPDRIRELSIEEDLYGKADGKAVLRYTLTNRNGMKVVLLSYGAIVQSVEVPDRQGRFENVTLGFDDLKGYTEGDPYFGAIVGRYANRIARGKFTLNGKTFSLATNNGPNHLHGGKKGLSDVVWQTRPLSNDVTDDDSVGLELSYDSPNGEEGYPGELNVTVTYRLNNDNELRIDYAATADQPTPVNLTNHCYWNLSGVRPGHANRDILGHLLMLNCPQYLPVDETLIPTGELKPVQGTPMDFTEPHEIGARIAQVTGGYDHCYVIAGQPGKLRLAASVADPKSRRVMEILTTEPGVQFYTGNFLDGSAANGGFKKHEGFCLECQHFPNSPNEPKFPNTILKPDQTYTQTTIHRFSVD